MARVFLSRLASSNDAAAAAEMALVTPILIVLMFGSFEVGNYFLRLRHQRLRQWRPGRQHGQGQRLPAQLIPKNIGSRHLLLRKDQMYPLIPHIECPALGRFRCVRHDAQDLVPQFDTVP